MVTRVIYTQSTASRQNQTSTLVKTATLVTLYFLVSISSNQTFLKTFVVQRFEIYLVFEFQTTY